jgi:hypothetical protein
MRNLGVMVREPLHRRASFDDFNMCYEYASKRSGNSLALNCVFGYSVNASAGIFSNDHSLRNLANSSN